jgi:transcriptional regulator with XRE-family HTH domain
MADFGDEVRRLLAERGISLRELARQTHFHVSHLSNVCNGRKRVTAELAGVLDEVLGADGKLSALVQAVPAPVRTYRNALGAAEAFSTLVSGAPGVIPLLGDALDKESRADLMMAKREMRTEFSDVVGGEELLDIVEHAALGRPAPVPGAGGVTRIDRQQIAQIESLTMNLRRWDNEFGSGMCRKAVIGQLNEASALLEGPFRDEQTGRRLFSAVTDLVQLAGWMSYDLQMHATAQRYYMLGLRMAREAGDRAQVARLLYCLSRQMVELGRQRDALELAQLGLYTIRRSPAPKPAALLHLIAARAYACMGEARECNRSLDIAQHIFSRAGADTDPAWCAFFDEGELRGLLGVTLRDLALADDDHAPEHAAVARPWIELAISQRPTGYLRSKVLDMDGLAVVWLLLGEAEEATTMIISALSLADGVASSRVTARFQRTVLLAEQRFPGTNAIAELRGEVTAHTRRR